jgi:hypothetical protein
MSANVFYNRIIRKLVVGFGNLFDNITLVRYNADLTEQERFIIPIAYAPKERYVMRLQEDPNLDKKVQLTLPRLSFEMTGMTYDSTRKQNTNWKTFNQTSNGLASQYNPVPYNFNFSLYLYVRNIEDGTQAIEHILPYFTPDYTIKLNLIPEMGIIKEIPIVLDNVTQDITYEGPRDNDTRLIIWTLNFTVKGFIFGGVTENNNIIKTSITNVLNDISITDSVQFNMANTGVGQYQAGELVYQGYSPTNSTATGRVYSWSNTNHQLVLTDISGNFLSTQSIIGVTTNANWVFTSYQSPQIKMAQVVVTPNPNTATANDKYTYTTSITEEPKNFNY